MNKRQRIALQRSMCREAIAKLLAAAEFFGAEDHIRSEKMMSMISLLIM